MNNNYLDKALGEYAGKDIYPFHMPGHKRHLTPSLVPERIDITEIPGFDDLRHPESILKEAQERLARVFGSPRSYFLINGSTAGNLASICACARAGDTIIASAGCHWSVHNAAHLRGLSVYEIPALETGCAIAGSFSPKNVRSAIEAHPDCAAVVITSPSYEGVVSDITGIADIVHAHGIPLIVDSAHGAHLGFHPAFSENAVSLGADIAVESLHKTLPSFTQTAALHVCSEEFTGHERVEEYLRIFQSSSPSYILMASIDRCTRILEENGAELFDSFAKRLSAFYEKTAALKNVKILAAPRPCPETPKTLLAGSRGIFQKDPSRIIISGTSLGLSGCELFYLLLSKYRLQMEKYTDDYVVAIATIMDTDEGFERLAEALLEIDGEKPDS